MNYAVTVSGQQDLPPLTPDTAAIVALEPDAFDTWMNPALHEQRELLCLAMDDVWDPGDLDAGFVMPEMWHVAETLKFVRENAGHPVHVACYAGVSRSTALALLALWERRPAGAAEREVLAELDRIRPGSAPNPLLTFLVDAALGTRFLDLLTPGAGR